MGSRTLQAIDTNDCVRRKQNENYQCFTHWQGRMESMEKGLGIYLSEKQWL